MIATTGNKTMLYCPKCRRTYEEGTQRFCDNDGGRLLPAPNAAPRGDAPGSGTFTSLLGKTPAHDTAERKTAEPPRFIPLNKTEEADKKLTSFPSAGRIFQSEKFLHPEDEKRPILEDSILELDPPPVDDEDDILELDVEKLTYEISKEEPKPLPRLVRPDEIASGTGTTGDRRSNPLGRAALSRENPRAIVGQTVKGRYQIMSELESDDEDSLIYLAEDQIVKGRKVVVRVFMDQDAMDETEAKMFAEERVSLSHLKHPNVAGVFDSGELPEGKEFIISEFVEGKSLADMLGDGQFNALRTARIIRQTSYALSEAHQNGILHRSLRPENIVLTVTEVGIEQVKLMNFGASFGEITPRNLAYKAPEEIEKGASTYASDIYSLAVVAFKLLTARMPFEYTTESELVRAQKAGLKNPVTNWRLDIQPLADKIIEKALNFNPAERYPKARDFGDALFNALTTVAPWAKEDPIVVAEPVRPREYIVVPALEESIPTNKIEVPEIGLDETVGELPVAEVAAPVMDEPRVDETIPVFEIPEVPVETAAEVDARHAEQVPFVADAPIPADIHITPQDEPAPIAEVRTPDVKTWEKRSPEPPSTGSTWRGWAAIAGVVALLLVFWGIARWYITRQVQDPATVTVDPNLARPAPTANDPMPVVESDMPPPARNWKMPENFVAFRNSRENLSEELGGKQFLAFSAAYPKSWTKSSSEKNFFDVVNKTPSGMTIEEMIVTRYESRGTMTLDKANFPKLVASSNADLKKFFGESYRVVSEGDAMIQNRWKVHEVKFQGLSPDKKIVFWGRRLWLPVQIAGEQNGFVITLLATSLSTDVEGVNDVGIKGDLATVLESFEPEPRN